MRWWERLILSPLWARVCVLSVLVAAPVQLAIGKVQHDAARANSAAEAANADRYHTARARDVALDAAAATVASDSVKRDEQIRVEIRANRARIEKLQKGLEWEYSMIRVEEKQIEELQRRIEHR